MRSLLVSVLVGGLLPILFLPSLAHRPRQPTGKAPLERLIEGFRAPTGIAVAPDGTLFFTDEDEGSLFQRAPNGTLLVLHDRLRQPRGLVRAHDGTLYLVAERMRESRERSRFRGLLLKRSSSEGTLTRLASDFQQPQQLFRDADGSLLLSTTEGLRSSRSRAKDDDEDSDDEEDRRNQQAKKPEPFPGVVFRVNPAEVNPAVRIVRSYSGFQRPAGLWQDETGQIIVAAEGFRSGGLRLQGSLFRIASDGRVTLLLPARFERPAGLIQDALGALYLAVKEAQEEDDKDDEEEQEGPDGGLILKVAPDGTFTYFAAGFGQPWGLGLDAHGNLYVSDPDAGRIYRFLAPGPPLLGNDGAPTNQPHITLSGRAETTAGHPEPEARITVRGGQNEEVTTLAGRDGTFTFAGPHAVPLNPDQLNTLQVYATGARGEGLTGAPTTITVLQDSTHPAVAFRRPTRGDRLSGNVPVEITASDSGSGLAAVEFLVDGVLQGRQPVPPSTFTLETATFTLNTAPFAPGSHTLTAQALDQAGNSASISITVEFTRLQVTITEPADGATLTTASVLVRGTVESAGVEVGVVVNGFPAFVSGTRWAAEVRVVSGTNPIIATATDGQGGSTTARISVQVTQVQERLVTLKASPVSGLAPLIVQFTVESALDRPIVQYAFDHDGDGIADLTSPSFQNVQVTYTTSGLVTPTLMATDDRGRIITARTSIQVLDQAAAIALFRGKWGALRAALTRGDIEGALEGVAVGVRARYRPVLRALTGDLPGISASLGDLQVISVQDGLAEAATVRLENGQRRVYFIYFVPDEDGLWRIGGM